MNLNINGHSPIPIRRQLMEQLRHAIELENRTQVLATFTGNMTEAGKAFVEGRAPEWRPM